MDWLLLIRIGIAGITAGSLLGFRFAARSAEPTLQGLRRHLAQDRNRALTLLRRELANWLIRHDTDGYVGVYRDAHRVVAAIKMMSRDAQRRELSQITKKYPFYEDFDMLQTREWVLYEDALSKDCWEDVVNQYTTLIRFQALQASLNPDWADFQLISETELVHLEEYVEQLKDTQFKDRMKAAMRQFRAWEKGRSSYKNNGVYETGTFIVRRVTHFAESRCGVHFKDTNEYGLYGVFHGDNGEIYIGIYRTDSCFQ